MQFNIQAVIRRRPVLAVVCSLVLASSLCAQIRPRIVTLPDNSVLTRIPGTAHPLVGASTLLGQASAGMAMERILLRLSSSPEQQMALTQLLAEQQDPASPQYHQWLSPAQFGEKFGAAPEDIATVTAWLESQGFRVTEVAAGRRAIEFSGTARQVETAFHTRINRYRWNGQEHVANATDISIPTALSPVVAGVASLHDFGTRPMHRVIAKGASSLTDFTGGQHGMSPYDFAAIYDLTPLWSAGYDGTGQSIAIVGESDIQLSDVANFRAQFGLPVNNPTIIVNGRDPGIVATDETESDLDVEWAGAVARGASIQFVTSASTSASDGVTLSAQYIVQHATAPVMSVSYGACEALIGSSIYFYSSLWEQASAEGIAVFVANGDSGSAGCDNPDGGVPATQGFGLNGLASTPNNVAVGGTEFNDTASPATYWNSSNSGQLASANGYIPEIAWNESSTTGSNLYAGGGGASLVFARQSWQAGTGVPSGNMRLTPDVSLTAAAHDGYIVEQNGYLYLVGGTSGSTPALAGLMAIVNQYTRTANGNPNGKFYALAAAVPSAYHDVTSGSNAVPCAGGSPDCSASSGGTIGNLNGYNAGVGYDLATGLGSVDANVLVTNWDGASAAPAIVSLSPNPLAGSASVQNLTINGAGFVSGSGLQVTVGSTVYQGSAVEFVSSGQLVVSVNPGVAAQSLPVRVTLPGGQVTNAATLTVTAPAAGPAISGLSPNSIAGSSSPQSLTIDGSGFVGGSALKVTVGGTVYEGPQITVVSATQLSVSVTVGATAQTLPVQVIDPSGQASNAMTLTVTAPVVRPVIASLTPNPMTGSGSSQTLTINGSGFVAGSGLKVTVGSAVYQGPQITAVSATQLAITVGVGVNAQTLPVQVTDPSGQASNTLALTVVAPPPPLIASIDPTPLIGSSSPQTLTINGSGFQPGLKLAIGGTLIVASQLAVLTPTELQVSLVTGLGAHTYAVEVANSNGTVSNVVDLQVNAPPVPSIASLMPNPTFQSAMPQSLTVNGANFQSGAGLKVTVGGTSYSGSQVYFIGPTQLQVFLTISSASAGMAVQVTNPSGAASNSVSLVVR